MKERTHCLDARVGDGTSIKLSVCSLIFDFGGAALLKSARYFCLQ